MPAAAPIVIDPTKLGTATARENTILSRLLLDHKHAGLFSKNEIYTIVVPDETDPRIMVELDVSLTHDIFHRNRMNPNKSDEDRFEIIATDPLNVNSGDTRSIFPIAGTLAPNHTNGLKFKNHHKRIVKIEDHSAVNTTLSLPKLESEFNITKEAGDLHIKHPTLASRHSFTAMKLLKGESLNSFIYNGTTLRNKKQTTQLIDITINLLLAVQRLHDQGIIHRDLKPDNIFIDPKTNAITILDYGLSKKIDSTTTENGVGTPGYFPPEHAKNTFSNQQSDLFSLGQVIGELFRKKEPDDVANHFVIKGRDVNGRIQVYANDDPAKYRIPMLRGYDLSSTHKLRLVALLNKLTSYEAKERGSIESAIAELEKLRIERKTYLNTSNAHHVKVAHENALKARENIRLLLKNTTAIAVKTAVEVRHLIMANVKLNLEPLKNHPLVIQEFVETLKIAAFKGINNKEKLFSKIDDINNNLVRATDDLIKLKKYFNVCLETITDGPSQEKLRRNIAKVDDILAKKANYAPSIDGTVALTARYQAALKKINISIQKYPAIDRIVSANQSRHAYRQALKAAIKTYKANQTVVSERRQKDIQKLEALVKDRRFNDTETLANEVKTVTRQFRGGFNGFFNRGELVNRVNKATDEALAKRVVRVR